jgi:hypothetical protein
MDDQNYQNKMLEQYIVPDGCVRRSFPNILKPKIVDKFSDEEMESMIGIQTYQPHIWAVEKDDIYDAIDSLDRGIGWLKDSLEDYKLENTKKYSFIDDQIMFVLEKDILMMEQTLKNLMGYDESAEIYKNGH